MSISIKNKKQGGYGEYVGRGSPLGNPFKFKYDCAKERDIIIEKYRTWLYEKIEKQDKNIINELERLYEIASTGDLNLLCFCVATI